MSNPHLNDLPPDFYCSIEEAVNILNERRKSLFLFEKTQKQIKFSADLEVLTVKPHLIMFRQLLTPLNEILVFLDIAKKYHLQPLVIEYYDDKFVSTGNKFKRGLGKMPIYKFSDKNGHAVIEFKTVVDFNSFVGKPIKEVQTIYGKKLIDFHHDLFFQYTKIATELICRDGSSWFRNFSSSSEYYEHFLKFFIRDAILFETFLVEGSERELTFNTVLPAYVRSCEIFGEKPLIVRAEFEDKDNDLNTLDFYPHQVGEIFA